MVHFRLRRFFPIERVVKPLPIGLVFFLTLLSQFCFAQNPYSLVDSTDDSFFRFSTDDVGVRPLSYRQRLEAEYAGKPPSEIPPEVQAMFEAFADLDRAASDPATARDSLLRWRRQKDKLQPYVVDRFKDMKIVPTGDPNVPWELQVKGKPVYRFTKRLGQGSDSANFSTTKGTVVKVSLKPNKALALGTWGEDLYNRYGVNTAKILNVDPNALYIEQEFLPGGNMEDRYRSAGRAPPDPVARDAVNQWENAVRMGRETGFFHDFKPDNFVQNAEGRVVTVDLSPLYLEDWIHTGFANDRGSRLMTQDEFLKRFFGREIPADSLNPLAPAPPSLFGGCMKIVRSLTAGK